MTIADSSMTINDKYVKLKRETLSLIDNIGDEAIAIGGSSAYEIGKVIGSSYHKMQMIFKSVGELLNYAMATVTEKSDVIDL